MGLEDIRLMIKAIGKGKYYIEYFKNRPVTPECGKVRGQRGRATSWERLLLVLAAYSTSVYFPVTSSDLWPSASFFVFLQVTFDAHGYFPIRLQMCLNKFKMCAGWNVPHTDHLAYLIIYLKNWFHWILLQSKNLKIHLRLWQSNRFCLICAD